MGGNISTSARAVTSWNMQENSMEFECQALPKRRAWLYLSCASTGLVMPRIIFLKKVTFFKKIPYITVNMNALSSVNFLLWYVVGSKSFRPDIQKPRQMENAVRDI